MSTYINALFIFVTLDLILFFWLICIYFEILLSLLLSIHYLKGVLSLTLFEYLLCATMCLLPNSEVSYQKASKKATCSSISFSFSSYFLLLLRLLRTLDSLKRFNHFPVTKSSWCEDPPPLETPCTKAEGLVTTPYCISSSGM